MVRAVNSLTVGPDGAVYASDFEGGHIYRFAVPAGTRSVVTASAIALPNGLAFDPDGTLLVLSNEAAAILRLTLDEQMYESGRQVIARGHAGGPRSTASCAMPRIAFT